MALATQQPVNQRDSAHLLQYGVHLRDGPRFFPLVACSEYALPAGLNYGRSLPLPEVGCLWSGQSVEQQTGDPAGNDSALLFGFLISEHIAPLSAWFAHVDIVHM